MLTKKPKKLLRSACGSTAGLSKFVALSFFTGAMGLDLGFERAGIHTVLASEIDEKAVATIKANRPHLPVIGDIMEHSEASIKDAAGLSAQSEIDLIFGGPPCQAFSTAGKRQSFEDARGNVFLKYIELILGLRPRYAVIENVRGLLSAPLAHRPHAERGVGFAELNANEEKGGALFYILGQLRGAGYGVSFNLYNSANYGAPQIRERVVILCSRDGAKLPYLSPTHAEGGKFGLKPWRTLRDVVSDLPENPCDFVKFPEKRLRFYRMLKQGQNWRDLPVDLQKEAMGQSFFAGGGKTGFYRRLAWDKPSPTLVTHPAMPATDLAHPEKDRPLSVQEYKRLQEFSDSWILCGSLIDQYRQIGNAVPTSLGLAIGKAILSHDAGISISNPTGFEYSRYKATDDAGWENEYLIQSATRDQPVFDFAK